MSRGLVVLGTDTDAGKTYLSAALATYYKMQGFNVGVFKLLQTGAFKENDKWISPDLATIGTLTRLSEENLGCGAYFKLPASPHFSAEVEGKSINLQTLIADARAFASRFDIVIFEGCGGLMVPLDLKGTMLLDLIIELDYPVVFAAKSGVGTLNHSIMTLNVARQYKLDIRGLYLCAFENSPSEASNLKTLKAIYDELNVSTLPKFESEPSHGNWSSYVKANSACFESLLWETDLQNDKFVTMSAWQARDLATVWHPCSQMKDYEAFKPIVIKKAKGAYLYDLNGNSYLDAVSSWWVNLFGHGNSEINEALTAQANQLEHVIFANFTHKPAIELAEALLQRGGGKLSKVFYADNGSSAIEVALKMSFQYCQQNGQPGKHRFAALTDAYHGETLGALGVGDLGLYSAVFKPLMQNALRLSRPDCYRCPFGEERHSCQAPCAREAIHSLREHQNELCALIIEPMIQCAAGMKIYSKVFLKRLVDEAHKLGILVIADEIAVGFGRSGKFFAYEHAGVQPDFVCVSKGLTAGYLPLSAVMTTDKIYEAFYADYNEQKAFMHSHSYTGNPITCAVALKTLSIFDKEEILEKNELLASHMYTLGKKLEAKPQVGEYRQLGMVGAIELVKSKSTKEGFSSEERVGYKLYQLALEKGVLLRPLGNVIYFMPPYCVSKSDIEKMIEAAAWAIDQYFLNH